MIEEKKYLSLNRIILAVFLFLCIAVISWVGYSHYLSSRWLTVKESQDEWIEIKDKLVENNSAPCPDMVLTDGKAKFIENLTDNEMLQLGYKITVRSEMGKQEKDPSKYAPYLYQVRFRFTLVDKDGFPLQIVEGPPDYEIFEISKTVEYQNVCPEGIPLGTAKKTKWVSVSYILSATGPKKY